MTLELELIQHGALSLALPVSLSHSLSLLPSLPVVVSRIVTHTHTFSLSYGGCSPTLPQHAWGSTTAVMTSVCTRKLQVVAGFLRRVGEIRSADVCTSIDSRKDVSLFNRKLNVRLPGKGDSNSHGARPLHLIVTMMKWFRTSWFVDKELSLYIH
jgi:hypothetical protein